VTEGDEMQTQTTDQVTESLPQMKLRVDLGRQWLSGEEVARLACGSVIELNSLPGGEADVYAGSRLAARGSLVSVQGMLGVKVTRKLL
jgi:type III secretion protein Q